MKYKLKSIFLIILLSNSFFISLLVNVTSIGGISVLSEQEPLTMVSYDTFNPKFQNYSNKFKICIDRSNHIYIGGHISHDQYDSLSLMTDMKGNLLWENLSSIGRIEDIAIDSLGNVYCTGVKFSTTQEILFLKYSKTGEFLWDKTLTAKGDEWGRGISVDSLDNVYITGYNSSITTDDIEIICAKYNALGEQQWIIEWGKEQHASCFDCVTDISNNIYLVGQAKTSLYNDMCIVKYDSLGNQLWNLTFPCNKIVLKDERLYAIISDKNENIYVAGDIQSKGIYLASFDSNGNNLWNTTRVIDHDKDLGVNDLAIDTEGNLYIIGNYRPLNSGDWQYNDYLYNYIIKYRNGIEQWYYYWKISDFNIIGGIALNKDDIYICGSTGGTLYLAKFSESPFIIPLYFLFLWVSGTVIIFIGTHLFKKRKIVKSRQNITVY